MTTVLSGNDEVLPDFGQPVVLIEPHYLPTLEFFCILLKSPEIRLERHGHFIRQGWRNRTVINTSNGTLTLSVPLSHKGNRVPLGDVTIDHSGHWARNHWRSIESAYRNAPFFEHYETPFREALLSRTDSLFEFNVKLLSICLEALSWTKVISVTEKFIEKPDVADFRDRLAAKQPFSQRSYYRPVPYYQVFGSTFAANLSLIDLLFCCGPSACKVLEASGAENR